MSIGKTPFRYDYVGSFLRPEALKKARCQFDEGKIGYEELKVVEEAAITELVQKVKALGYHVITDGEFRRATWHLDFMWGFDGIGHTPTKTGLPFHGEAAMVDDTYLVFAGLVASAAILMLVFKDTLLGFVAGIQLSANDMLRPGDWITMEKYGANGTVIEVTLNAVKVKNFDNTITTIPPYALVSDAFQNWRGMSESPGRRIKRSINIDMNSVSFCTPEMLTKFRKISLLTDYIDEKEKELNAYNEAHRIDDSIRVNGRRQTNIGVFRAYLVNYLKSLPEVSKELTCMVRQLQPTETGIPIELYFFSSVKDWVPYEGIQSDVFDHVLAVIPEFGLSVFQNVSGSDLRSLKIVQ